IRDFHVTGVQTCALPIFPPLPAVEWPACCRYEGGGGDWPTRPLSREGDSSPGWRTVGLDGGLASSPYRNRPRIEGGIMNRFLPQIGRASCRARVAHAVGE